MSKGTEVWRRARVLAVRRRQDGSMTPKGNAQPCQHPRITPWLECYRCVACGEKVYAITSKMRIG